MISSVRSGNRDAPLRHWEQRSETRAGPCDPFLHPLPQPPQKQRKWQHRLRPTHLLITNDYTMISGWRELIQSNRSINHKRMVVIKKMMVVVGLWFASQKRRHTHGQGWIGNKVRKRGGFSASTLVSNQSFLTSELRVDARVVSTLTLQVNEPRDQTKVNHSWPTSMYNKRNLDAAWLGWEEWGVVCNHNKAEVGEFTAQYYITWTGARGMKNDHGGFKFLCVCVEREGFKKKYPRAKIELYECRNV